jgi:Deoxyribonuclease II
LSRVHLLTGVQLSYYEPLVYEWRVGESLIDQVPDLVAVGSGRRKRQPPPFFRLTTLTSMAGLEAVSFAKSARFGKGKLLVTLPFMSVFHFFKVLFIALWELFRKSFGSISIRRSVWS